MSSSIFHLRLTVTVYLVDIFFKNIRQGLAKLHVFASHLELHPSVQVLKGFISDMSRVSKVRTLGFNFVRFTPTCAVAQVGVNSFYNNSTAL